MLKEAEVGRLKAVIAVAVPKPLPKVKQWPADNLFIEYIPELRPFRLANSGDLRNRGFLEKTKRTEEAFKNGDTERVEFEGEYGGPFTDRWPADDPIIDRMRTRSGV